MYFSNTDLLEVPAIWSFQPARSRRAASLDAAAVVPSKSCTIFLKKNVVRRDVCMQNMVKRPKEQKNGFGWLLWLFTVLSLQGLNNSETEQDSSMDT
jgi:hypothetical protein